MCIFLTYQPHFWNGHSLIVKLGRIHEHSAAVNVDAVLIPGHDILQSVVGTHYEYKEKRQDCRDTEKPHIDSQKTVYQPEAQNFNASIITELIRLF